MKRGDMLVGPAQIATMLRVAPNTVSMWRNRHLLPEPVAVISRVPVWTWQAIREWAEDTGRVDGVDARYIAEARSLLAATRTGVLAELEQLARGLRHLVAEPMQRPPAKLRGDGRGNGRGEWDWFYALSREERSQLSRRWLVASPTACTPDQYAAAVGNGDVDESCAAWLAAVRLLDAVRAIQLGRTPKCRLVSAEGFDVELLFSDSGAAHLADILADMVDRERPEQLEPYELDDVLAGAF